MSTSTTRDRGVILPMVLVVAVVLAVVVAAIATYTTTTLRYGQVVEERADELAAAQAAMDDAIERLRVGNSLCDTASDGVPVVANPSFPTINGVQAVATCEVIGGFLPNAAGWAMVITGEDPGGYASPNNRYLFDLSGGGDPIIEGSIFVDWANPQPEILGGTGSNDTTIQKGDLWFEDDACAGGTPAPTSAEDITFERDDATTTALTDLSNLVFNPSTRGAYCTNASWQDLFGTAGPPFDPSYAVTGAGNPNPAPDGAAIGTCKVFEPGVYDGIANKPVFAANNYMRSGVYVFRNLGLLDLSGIKVTFGNITDDPGYPIIDDNDTPATCQGERLSDPANFGVSEGAVVYLEGNTRLQVGNGSGFEISGRDIPDGTLPTPIIYRVALHANNSTPSVTDGLIIAGAGSGKDIAFSGSIWAPYSRIQIGAVASDKDAAFRGGLVAAIFEGTISNAPGGGFLIRAATTDTRSKTRLISTAGSTSVVVIGDWRVSTDEFAVNSWRVCDRAGC